MIHFWPCIRRLTTSKPSVSPTICVRHEGCNHLCQTRRVRHEWCCCVGQHSDETVRSSGGPGPRREVTRTIWADRELANYLPFVATTRVLMAAVKAGAGRETAHQVIKEHAVATALDLRESDSNFTSLIERLAGDDRLPLNADDLASLFGEPLDLAGRAPAQTHAVIARIGAICDQYPQAASYVAGDIF